MSAVKIVFNKVLGGWYVVRGPHQTPLSGRFDTKAEAQASLKRPRRSYTIAAKSPSGPVIIAQVTKTQLTEGDSP